MSMDFFLEAFEPADAPRERTQFLAWMQLRDRENELQRAALSEPATENLRQFFADMLALFPDVPGDHPEPLESSDQIAHYTFTTHSVAINFDGSVWDEATSKTLELCRKHGLGLWNADDIVIFPEDRGSWDDHEPTFWSLLTRLFKAMFSPMGPTKVSALNVATQPKRNF